jgi:HEAT repeat protein
MMLSLRHPSRWVLAFVVVSGSVMYAQETAVTLANARKAIAERRPGDAIVLADSVLRGKPTDREAYAVKIDAYLSSGERGTALKVYDTFAKATGQQSARLVAPIARATLRDLAAAPGGTSRVAALEHLARAGDRVSRSTIERLCEGPAEGDAATAIDALARLGDTGAQAAVRRRLDSTVAGQRAAAITLLAGFSPASVRPVLGRLLADADLDVQLAALQAAEDLRATETTLAVETLMTSDVPLVRLSAAATLVRLGSPAGRPLIDKAIGSEIADARLIAAQALSEGPVGTWAPALRAMLGPDTELLVRLQAASQLLPVERNRALPVLAAATTDPNPAVRDMATRLVAADPKADIAVLWPLLADTSASVRLTASGKLLDLDRRAAAVPVQAASPARRPSATSRPGKKPTP